MKNYLAPVLNDVNDKIEGVYAAGSGWNDEPTPTPTPHLSWDIRCEFRNHNSGSHSEVAVIGVQTNGFAGESITMNFKVDRSVCDLLSVKDWGGMTISNVSADGFTITRINHFNPNERFEFNIQITATNSIYWEDRGHEGAVGHTGEWVECPIKLTSYTVG